MAKTYSRKQIEAAIELARLTAARREREAKEDAALFRALADQNAQLLALIDKSTKTALHTAFDERARELSDIIELEVTESDIILGEPVAEVSR